MNLMKKTILIRSFVPAFALIFLLIRPSPAANLGNVNRYDVVELSYTYASPAYAAKTSNPWEQVQVKATFKSPSGKTLAINGFYYDVNQYKVRFTPAEMGAYMYTVTITGPSGPLNDSGSFTS